MNILIDNREKGPYEEEGSRSTRAKQYFNKENHKATITTLTYGDYLINDTIIWEYKTIQDYMQSLYNGTLFEEISNQTNNYPYSFIIIEGNFNKYLEKQWKHPNIHYKYNHNKPKYIRRHTVAYHKSMERINALHTHICFAKNEQAAFKKILSQSKKCLDHKHYGGSKRGLHTHDIVSYTLSGCDGVSDKLIGNIRSTYELNNLEDLLCLSKEDLVGVNLIGDKKADTILKWIHGGGTNE